MPHRLERLRPFVSFCRPGSPVARGRGQLHTIKAHCLSPKLIHKNSPSLWRWLPGTQITKHFTTCLLCHRLDRLLQLLDTGASQTVRQAAAKQIASIATRGLRTDSGIEGDGHDVKPVIDSNGDIPLERREDWSEVLSVLAKVGASGLGGRSDLTSFRRFYHIYAQKTQRRVMLRRLQSLIFVHSHQCGLHCIPLVVPSTCQETFLLFLWRAYWRVTISFFRLLVKNFLSRECSEPPRSSSALAKKQSQD